MKPARLLLRGFGPQPEQRPSGPRLEREERGEAGTAAGFARLGEDFVQSPTRQPSAEGVIYAAVAKGEQIGLCRRSARLEPFQAPPQLGKDKGRIAHVLIMFFSAERINRGCGLTHQVFNPDASPRHKRA